MHAEIASVSSDAPLPMIFSTVCHIFILFIDIIFFIFIFLEAFYSNSNLSDKI